MMGRKKLKSLAAFLATMSASFFIPLVVHADECISISATGCIGGCQGHTITSSDGGKRIQVSGGRHTITLDGVTIDTSNAADTDQYSAFDITGDATVELILNNNNSLKSPDGYAGLHIPSGSHLTIKGEGSLTATGGNNGAGIGSQGIDGASGEVTIAVAKTSTITATGGLAAAGIGGGQGGGCGKVTVESGNVNATGGNGYEVTSSDTGEVVGKVAGGTGIGTGGGGVGGGEIVLKGGEITAIGGLSDAADPDSQRTGIDCQKLSSGGGSANLYSNSPISDSTNIDEFNGIVWQRRKDAQTGQYSTVSGMAYGKAVLDKNIGSLTLTIRPGCSLTIPEGTNVSIGAQGSILGNNTTSIINADRLIVSGAAYLSPDVQKKVTLDRKDIVITTPNLVYTGKSLDHTDKNTKDEVYTITTPRRDNSTTYAVDETGWVPTYRKGGLVVTEIKDAGTYTVTYSNTNPNTNYKDFSFDVTVDKRKLESSMVKDIDDVLYTGSPQQPKVTLTYNNKELVEGTDYQPLTAGSYSNNVEVGDNTATVTILASQNGNFLGEIQKKFSIKPAVFSEENVTITPETTVYNGKKQEPTIQVLLEDGSELDKENYTVTPSTDNFIDATGSEPIVFTIEGKGNFSGKITKNYTISEAPLAITKVKPKDRQYNGTKEVEIEEVQFSGLVGTDKPSDIILESKGIIESENVNENGYSAITFDEFKLGGEKGKNYVIESPLPGEEIVLDTPVIISQADAPATPELKCAYEVSADYPGKFVATMTVDNAADGAEYQYRWKAKDSEEFSEWQTSNVFDNIVPDETWVIEAQSVGNDNIKQSEIGQTEVTFEKLEESKVPEGITIEFALNKDGETYTATVLPELPELEYFIGKSDEVPDEEDYLSAESGRNPHMKTDCEAATEYTAYVRFKETATHKASEPVKVTGFTETLVVKEPTISLVRDDSSGGNGSEGDTDNGGNTGDEGSADDSNARETSADDITLGDNEFLETGKVKITCKTKGATIYYTTDGTDPTDQDNEYTGPFEINGKGETTIKAFAIKDGREDSPTASATFIRRLLNVETPIITPEDGESFTGSILVTIECPTEGADIYYTTDGSEPDPTNKKQKYKEPFRINTSSTINAIAVMKDMDPSEMATASLEKLESTVNVYSSLAAFATTGEDTQNNPISDELMEKLGTNDKKVASESIVAQLTSELSVIGNYGDFTYDRMSFYDLVLKVKVDSEPLRDATADDFSEGGLTVTVPYPEGTSLEANDFAIAHMFGSGENTGKIETWQNVTVTKTPSGLQFTVTSASPLAIAWTTAVPNGPNSNNVSGGDNVVNPEEPNGDNNGDNNGGNNGDNQGNNNGDNQGDVTVTANPRDGGTGDGTTAGGNSTTTGTGNGTVTDAVRSAVSSVLPKTGDTSKLLVWVVLAVACVAVIVGVQLKAKKGNKKKK